MREVMLIVHFIGLAMGIGTSIGFIFLGVAGSKMEKEEGIKFALNSSILSRMGHIGLTLLIITGLYLMTPYWGGLTSRPLLMIKLGLVVLLTVLIIFAARFSKKAKKGEIEENLKKIRSLGPVILLVGLSIIILAVLVFL